MENLVFTQLSIPEVRQLFREELARFFAENPIGLPQTETGESGNKVKVKSPKKKKTSEVEK